MVILYEEEEVIGDVEYNQRLDFWNGRNYQNGGTGRHLGFGQLGDGRFFLIFGTQWQGESAHAEIVSPETIVKEAIKSENIQELDDFPELLDIYETKFNKKNIVKSKVFSVRINITEKTNEVNKKLEELKQKISDYLNLRKTIKKKNKKE
ncbi:MAG: hypothetical protein ACTSRI_02640 [Promethearchaeota archaeon]